MERKSLALILLIFVGLAACSPQRPAAPATETAAFPPEPSPTAARQEVPQPTAEPTTEPLAEGPEAAEAAPVQPTPEPSPTPIPTATAEPTSLISNFMLDNMTYTNEFTAGGQAPLSNGKYSEQAAPDSATETIITRFPKVAFGELNGQPVTATVLVSDPGGSGTFYTLHLVGLDEDEEPVELASVLLGDRIQIDNINIAYDQVTAELVVAGAEDPLCCPTQQVVQIYELWGENLVQTASDVVGGLAEPLPGDLHYRLWTWQRSLDKKTQAVTTIDDPQRYSLIFHEDGTFQYTADCNRGGGTFTADGEGAIRFHPDRESLVDCGEGSLFEAMRETLAQARAYRHGRNTLSLVWGDESIVDIFSDSGLVVPQEEGLGITTEQIRLASQGLFEEWTAVEIPARPAEPGSPPGSAGLPKHIKILFDQEDPAQHNGGPIMYIIPVDAYIDLWKLAGDTTSKMRMNAVYDFARLAQDPLPSRGVPVLPGEEAPGSNDLAAQIAHTGAGLNSASQTGYRFIGRVTEESGPLINQNLRYIYQGFTNDGKYLVAFFSPINTAELPDFSADLPQEKLDLFSQDVEQYLAAEAQALNDLPPEAWEPALFALDNLVNSLEITEMTPAGFKNKVWAWTGHVTNPETGEVIIHDLQGRYTIEFQEFTLDFVADCYEDSRSYDLIAGGLIGTIAVQPAEDGEIDCGPDSLAGQFAAVLQEASEVRVLPGGRDLILAAPGGQAEYLLRDVNALPLEGAAAAEFELEEDSETSPQTGAVEQEPVQPSTAVEADVEAEPQAETQAQAPGSVTDLVERGFSLELKGAAESYAWQVAPAVPIAAGPGGRGFPWHILITFDGEDPQQVLQNNGRHLFIFPLQYYKELYQGAGRSMIDDQAGRLRELIDQGQNRLQTPEGAMPLLPPASGSANRWAQYRVLDFTDGSGVRYLSDTPDRQAVGVWSNETTAYTYQGLTDDGRYYISLWWPVRTDTLPETADLAAQEIKARAVDPLTNPAYIRETAALLDALNPADFNPRLSQLDALVKSLTIGSAPEPAPETSDQS